MTAARMPPANRDDRLRRMFTFTDTDDNGYIDFDDLIAMIARVTGAFGTPPDSAKATKVINNAEITWQALLSELDLDGDRRISSEEYVRGMVRAFAEDGDYERALRPFVATTVAVADADNDGVLDRDEFRVLQRAISNTDTDPDVAFDKLDTDHSGTITTDELTAAAGEYLTGKNPQANGNWLFGYV